MQFAMVTATTSALGGTALGMAERVRALKADHTLSLIDDSLGTLADKEFVDISNFVVEHPDDAAFFRLLAR